MLIGKSFSLNNQIIELRVASDFMARLIGLMGKNNFDNKVLIIYKCQQIHTFFMRFPLDVIYLSEKGEMIHCDFNLKPWKIGKKIHGAYYVLECKAGMFKQAYVEEADSLTAFINHIKTSIINERGY